jgi:hypothetical protein
LWLLFITSNLCPLLLTEFMLRRPENRLVVASVIPSEAENMAKKFGSRVAPLTLDVSKVRACLWTAGV